MVNMKAMSIMITVVLISTVACAAAYADSVTILKQGILGAGTGAIASAMSGGKGDRIWQGALAGAGVTVVGGALLDMLTGERVGTVTYIREAQPVMVAAPAGRARQGTVYRRVYRRGLRDRYRQGYRDGYEDASYGRCGY
jgi:hypothetical protein